MAGSRPADALRAPEGVITGAGETGAALYREMRGAPAMAVSNSCRAAQFVADRARLRAANISFTTFQRVRPERAMNKP